MPIPNYAVLFCDDVREEKNDKNTYVGVMTNEVVIPENESSIIKPKLVVAVFLTWTPDKPPAGWSLKIDVPHGEGAPFGLPPEGSENIKPDPYTNIMGIVVFVEFSPLILHRGERILVRLVSERRKVNIGALSATGRIAVPEPPTDRNTT